MSAPRGARLAPPSSGRARGDPASRRTEPGRRRMAPRPPQSLSHAPADINVAWCSTACSRIGAGFGQNLDWAPGPMPTLCRLPALARAPAFGGLDLRGLLLDYSAPTALEVADGNWLAAVSGFGAVPLDASVHDLAQAFDTHLWPACAAQRTRYKNWRHWCTVLTLGHCTQGPPAPAAYVARHAQGDHLGPGLVPSFALADSRGMVGNQLSTPLFRADSANT